MTLSINVSYAQGLDKLSVNSLLRPIFLYARNFDRPITKEDQTPVEEIKKLRERTRISSQEAQSIHEALLKAYDVPHGYQGDLRSATIATIRLLAENNKKAFQKEMIDQWIEKSLSIVRGDQEDTTVMSAAIALLNSQWSIVKEKEDLPELLSCSISLMSHPDSGVCSAATALLNKQWNDLLPEQQDAVINKSIYLIGSSPDEISAALSLLRNHLSKDSDKRKEVFNKAGEILQSSDALNVLTSAAKLLVCYMDDAGIEPAVKKQKLQLYLGCLDKTKHGSVTAIFHAALEAQAGGSYSQTPIASPSTNGHRPARAAQPHQPAINLAAFVRPAPLSR
jgi:hypothetical protein